MKQILLSLISCALAWSSLAATSIDCRNLPQNPAARDYEEVRAICAADDLRALDREIADLYNENARRFSNHPTCTRALLENQRRWLEQRNDSHLCGNKIGQCLYQLMSERVTFLSHHINTCFDDLESFGRND